MKQKQHTGDEASGLNTDQKNPQDDTALANKASQGKSVLAKLEQATKKKGGHYEECCGVRIWVED